MDSVKSWMTGVAFARLNPALSDLGHRLPPAATEDLEQVTGEPAQLVPVTGGIPR